MLYICRYDIRFSLAFVKRCEQVQDMISNLPSTNLRFILVLLEKVDVPGYKYIYIYITIIHLVEGYIVSCSLSLHIPSNVEVKPSPRKIRVRTPLVTWAQRFMASRTIACLKSCKQRIKLMTWGLPDQCSKLKKKLAVVLWIGGLQYVCPAEKRKVSRIFGYMYNYIYSCKY